MAKDPHADSPKAPKKAASPAPPATVAPAPPPEDWTKHHLWQIAPVRDLLIVLGFVAFFSLGARLSIVTVPLMLAILLAYLFDPLIRRFAASRSVAHRARVVSLLVFASALLTVSIAIGCVFAFIQTGRLAAELTNKVATLLKSLDDPNNIEVKSTLGRGAWLSIHDTFADFRTPPNSSPVPWRTDHLRYFGIEREDLRAGVDLVSTWFKENSETVAKQALETGATALGSVVSFLVSSAEILFGAFLTAFFFYFFANEWEHVRSFMRNMLPRANRERALEIVKRMDHAIAGFVRGRLTIGLFLAVFYSVGFAAMGVPAPLLLGGAIAILSLVPYAVIAGIPVVVVLLWLESLEGFRGTWWWIIGAPILYYNIGQLIDDYVLTPAIQGKATDLATPEIVFASVAAGALFGFFGLLVAIPGAACLKILIVEVVWPRYQAWSKGLAQQTTAS